MIYHIYGPVNQATEWTRTHDPTRINAAHAEAARPRPADRDQPRKLPRPNPARLARYRMGNVEGRTWPDGKSDTPDAACTGSDMTGPANSIEATGAKPGDMVKCVSLEDQEAHGRHYTIGKKYRVVDFCGKPAVSPNQHTPADGEAFNPMIPRRGWGALWERVQ